MGFGSLHKKKSKNLEKFWEDMDGGSKRKFNQWGLRPVLLKEAEDF